MATNMSKKRKFVADGVFYAELNEVSHLPFSRSWHYPWNNPLPLRCGPETKVQTTQRPS